MEAHPEDMTGPTIWANRRTPIDVPDPLPEQPLQFTTRRKAEALPPLRPAVGSNGFDRGRDPVRDAWHRGFRWCAAAMSAGSAMVWLALWWRA